MANDCILLRHLLPNSAGEFRAKTGVMTELLKGITTAKAPNV